MKALWLLLLVASTASAAPAPDLKGADPSKLGGRELYKTLCAPCHGKALEGYAADHAPALAASTFLESATDDFLKASITTGRPGTSMAAYGKSLGGPLDDAAIARLVKFIRERGNVPPKQVTPLGIAGNAAAGGKLFDAQCKACHGDASTRGEAVQLTNQSFLLQATDLYLQHAIQEGRPNTKMVAFKDRLSAQNIADLVAFLRSGAVHSASAPPPPEPRLPAPTGKEPLVLWPKGKEPTWKLREDRFVPVDDVKKAYDEKRKFVIIDARPPSEWMRVHVDGAVSIPYFDMARLSEIPKDTWVIAYCACPHHLSGIVIDKLRELGHTKSAILDEGINDWHRKGYPVVAAPGVEKPAAEPIGTPGQIR